jgi:hypothetical protein
MGKLSLLNPATNKQDLLSALSSVVQEVIDHLPLVAEGFGIKNISQAASRKELADILKDRRKELRFLHVPAVPGNRDVPNIPLHHLEVKKQVQEFLGAEKSISLQKK